MGTANSPAVNRDALLNGLRLIVRRLSTVEEGFAVPIPGYGQKDDSIAVLSESEIETTIQNLKALKSNTENSFFWLNKAEFTLVPLNPHGLFERYLDGVDFTGQGDNPVTYTVGSPSKEVTAYLLCLISEKPDIVKQPRWTMLRNRIRKVALRVGGEIDGQASLLDLVAEAFYTVTLKIESTQGGLDYENLANSFLFHTAYNMDLAARIGPDPLFAPSRIQGARRPSCAEFDPPRQTYGSDLVQHYLMGVAAEIPLLEYLSFYHIAEHYFEKVFNDDLIEQVRKGITDPSFSVRRAKDIQAIIRTVNKAQRQVKEEGGVNEQRALHLALERFVDIGRLVTDLDNYDANLVSHYRENGVPFAGASKLDLTLADEEAVRSSMAKRIYKVRNALVHAKDGDLPKYAPFAHDDELSKEIPLMRFTSEQIIIAHGKVL
ncbi:hypothetical protein [Streptomyces sp. Tu10]|uniref:hypothetical protein n=1 Tax=Streptomyces sp. Tu10 TaxID=2838018 RepID=UPI001BDCB224|nr:hypothetical protein [Streptomyces sp. Tu10]MBT1101800.1 hypothetical protein [Streptomyces sp. Tu10]